MHTSHAQHPLKLQEGKHAPRKTKPRADGTGKLRHHTGFKLHKGASSTKGDHAKGRGGHGLDGSYQSMRHAFNLVLVSSHLMERQGWHTKVSDICAFFQPLSTCIASLAPVSLSPPPHCPHLCLEPPQRQIKGASNLCQRASLHRCTAPTCALSPCMVRMLEGDRKLSSQNLNCPPSLATASSQPSYAATTAKCSLPVAVPEANNQVGGREPGPGVYD